MIADLSALPIDQRIQLVEDIWDSIAADQAMLPVSPEQKKELDQRIDAYELDGQKGYPVGDAVARIRKRL